MHWGLTFQWFNNPLLVWPPRWLTPWIPHKCPWRHCNCWKGWGLRRLRRLYERCEMNQISIRMFWLSLPSLLLRRLWCLSMCDQGPSLWLVRMLLCLAPPWVSWLEMVLQYSLEVIDIMDSIAWHCKTHWCTCIFICASVCTWYHTNTSSLCPLQRRSAWCMAMRLQVLKAAMCALFFLICFSYSLFVLAVTHILQLGFIHRHSLQTR